MALSLLPDPRYAPNYCLALQCAMQASTFLFLTEDEPGKIVPDRATHAQTPELSRAYKTDSEGEEYRFWFVRWSGEDVRVTVRIGKRRARFVVLYVTLAENALQYTFYREEIQRFGMLEHL